MSRQSVLGYVERWFLHNGKNIRGKMVELQTSPRLADFLSLRHADTIASIAKEYNLILHIKADYAFAEGDFKVVVL